MKHLLIIFLILTKGAFCQYSIQHLETSYSSKNGGYIGEDNMIFKMDGSYLTIIDKDFNTKSTYGPLKFYSQGYTKAGLYEISYVPKNLPNVYIGYSYFFSEKGGELLGIQELIVKRKESNIYYTDIGYEVLVKGTEQKTSIKSININKIILSANTAEELQSLIECEFTVKSRTDLEGGLYNITYDIGDNIGLVAMFDLSDKCQKFKFFVPNENCEIIKNTLMENYKLTYDVEFETEKIETSQLSYYFGKVNEKTGMIFIEKN